MILRCERSVCPVCEAEVDMPGLTITDVPVVCHRLYTDVRSAREIPRSSIKLVSCRQCGHLFNAAYDGSLVQYEHGYNNDLHHSQRFQRYQDELIDHLTTAVDLRGCHVLEIGCGQGDFLRTFCGRANCTGTGYDPAVRVPHESDENDTVTLRKGAFTAERVKTPATLIVMRHVLEHLDNPHRALSEVLSALDPNNQSALYIEVPSGDYMLRENALWDLLYEHVSYFTNRSLATLLHRLGLCAVEMKESFGGQYLTVLAKPVSAAEKSIVDSGAGGDCHGYRDFSRTADCRIKEWRQKLQDWIVEKKSVAIWGAGTKGVMFLHHMGSLADSIHVVDVSPAKLGCYVTGVGTRILSPEDLRAVNPDVLLIANAIYRAEIEQKLASFELAPIIVCL